MKPKSTRKVCKELAMFADEVGAHRYLERVLWPDGVCCPRCGSAARVGKLGGTSTRAGTYKCYGCPKVFSFLHGTVLSSSHVPAHKWLQAIYLTNGGTRLMKPYHLQQILQVSYRTASSMMSRIGKATDSMRPLSTTETIPQAAPSNRLPAGSAPRGRT